MNKLKGLNFKQFFVDHFEKVLFGVVILGGLLALAMSSWSPYDAKNPQEVINKTKEAAANHKVATWPEAQQQKYAKSENISAKAKELLAPLPISQYAYAASQPELFSPVRDLNKRIGEINWLPVQQMIADAGRVLISVPPPFDPEAAGAAGSPEGSMPANPGGTRYPGVTGYGPGGLGAGQAEPKELNPYSRRGAAAGMGGYGAGYGEGAIPGASGAGFAAPAGAGGPGAGLGRGGAGEGEFAAPGAGYPGAMGAGGMGFAQNMEGEGKRYVSIRGVFPLKEQEEILREQLGLRTSQQAAQQLAIRDYEIQRQEAQPGPKPWSGPWEKVDITIAQDVIKSATGTDRIYPMPIDPSVKGYFTMPLPMLLMGIWTEEEASHPALTNFSKTSMAKEQEEYIEAKIAEYMERKAELKEKFGGSDHGWLQYNSGGAMGMMGMGQAMMGDQQFIRGMQSDLQQLPGGQRISQDTLKDQIKRLINASGAYLLFRYLDFDVKPGHAYRYRVRVEVRNPAYNLPVSRVKRPDIALGATRWTEWSEPTPPVIVPRDTQYFLAAINPGAGRRPKAANFKMFQWTPERGTMVTNSLNVLPGTMIGGMVETSVIDVAENKAEAKEVDFVSGDTLLDIRSASGSGRKTGVTASGREYTIPDRVLLMNNWGGLEVSYIGANSEQRNELTKQYQLFSSEYEKLFEDEKKVPGYPGGEGEFPGGPMGSGSFPGGGPAGG